MGPTSRRTNVCFVAVNNFLPWVINVFPAEISFRRQSQLCLSLNLDLRFYLFWCQNKGKILPFASADGWNWKEGLIQYLTEKLTSAYDLLPFTANSKLIKKIANIGKKNLLRIILSIFYIFWIFEKFLKARKATISKSKDQKKTL